MRVPLTFRVPIEDDWDAGARLQVYTNNGSGAIDTSAPLLARAKSVFPGAVKNRGYGLHAYGRGGYGTLKPARRRRGGYGERPYGKSAYGESQAFVEVTVNLPAAFGLWKFGVKAIDAEGNAQSGALIEFERVVSGTEPAAMRTFAFNAYNAGTDTFTFDVT